jgi:Pyruvate/2-oxoacid:ferredoxin oxidoreductase delta subunit
MAVTDHNLNDGRPSVQPIPGETETLQVARIVRTIGAEVDMVWQPFENQKSIRLSLSHCVLTGDEFPTLYGGDIVNRKLRVSDAIASGKQAAMAIDLILQNKSPDIERDIARYQQGTGPAISFAQYMDGGDHQPIASRIVTYEDINPAYFLPAMRLDPTAEDSDKQGLTFTAEQSNYTPQIAAKEAERCFSCGVCTDCDNCSLFCPETAVLSEQNRQIDLDYCKGCGVCVEECPRSAMILQETGYETGS